MGIALIVYGVIVLGGGIAGFRSAGSRVSLMMGAVSGFLLAICGALVILGNRTGGYFGVGVTAVLILVFAMRYAKTRKMMPAGLMLAVSVIMAAIFYTELGS